MTPIAALLGESRVDACFSQRLIRRRRKQEPSYRWRLFFA